jgi:hypothetical protein
MKTYHIVRPGLSEPVECHRFTASDDRKAHAAYLAFLETSPYAEVAILLNDKGHFVQMTQDELNECFDKACRKAIA